MAPGYRPTGPPGPGGIFSPSLDPSVRGTVVPTTSAGDPGNAIAGRNTSGATRSTAPVTPPKLPYWATVEPPAPSTANTPIDSMNPTQVRALQQFLNNHGFQVAQDGIAGPLTKLAAAAFRANHAGGEAWSAQHGIGVHPGSSRGAAPRNTSGAPPAAPGPTTPGANGSDPTAMLLQAMLANSGNVGQGYDPASFGAAAAAPDTAAAQIIQRLIAANPSQEAQNQADISSWYGLDPKAASYKLSVLGRLGQAKTMDANAATAASNNISNLAQSLAGSIGGSANAGSGSVAAAGANAAGTAQAIGEANKTYADQMNPLIAAEAAGAASRDKASNSQIMLGLQDQLAAAQGQGRADRAAGVMSAQGQNNALAQQRFANQGNLLGMLAQMAAANPNSPTIANMEGKAKIAQILAQAGLDNAKTNHLTQPGSNPAKGSWEGATADQRASYAKAISQFAAQSGMTWEKAMAFAQTLANTYFPNGGIPNTAGVIRGILSEAGLVPPGTPG